MPDIVLDCSVVGSWVLEDEIPAYPISVLECSHAVAPELLLVEFSNLLLCAERVKRITAEYTTECIAQFAELRISFESTTSRESPKEVIALARQQRLTAYDAVYLHLAIKKGLPLLTYDKALQKAARKCGLPKFKV